MRSPFRWHWLASHSPPLSRWAAVGVMTLALLGIGESVLCQEPSPAQSDEPDDAEVPRPPRKNIVDPDLVPSASRSQTGTVEIRGLKQVTDEEARTLIRFQLRNIEENGVTMARADDAAFFLERELRNRGYDKAVTNWEIAPGNLVILTVDEGAEVFFGDVSADGNHHLSIEAIRELLTQATRKRLGYQINAPKIPYVAADVDQGIAAIQHLYEMLGYREAEVVLTESQLNSETQSIDVTLTVKEGRLRKIGEISFLNPIIAELEPSFAGMESKFEGKPYTAAVEANLEDRVASIANEQGFFDASVEVRAAPPRKMAASTEDPNASPTLVIDLVIEPDWGKRYSLGKIEVTGVEKIDDDVIDGRFNHLIGEHYSPEKVSKEVTSLLESGAFDNLSIEPLPQADGTITLEVQAEESKQRALGIYGGVGTYEGIIIGLEFRNSNFLHRLHTFEAALELTGRGIHGNIDYSDPRFRDSPWSFKIGIESENERNEGYEVFNLGLRVGFQRHLDFRERHRIGVFANPSQNKITDATIEDQFLGPQEYFVSQLGFIYSFDGRDDPVTPRKGFAADLVIAGANSGIGSEVEFLRTAFRTSYSLPLGKTTLRLGARAGIIDPAGDDELPIDLRFFNGGARSVRSFRERDLGPRDRDGHPLGGEFSTVFNVEYEIPIAGPLSIAPFLDAGNLLSRAEDAGLDEMHYAGGAGLILNSPIGPLRIDYGINLNQAENEPSSNWHVGFGFSF